MNCNFFNKNKNDNSSYQDVVNESINLTTINDLFKNLNEIPCPANLKVKINQKLDSSRSSIFDIFFGLNHNPYKAGLTVGVALLATIILSANIVNIIDIKPKKTEVYIQAANFSNPYTSQFVINK